MALPYQTVDVGVGHVRFLGGWDVNKRRIAANVGGPVRLNPRLGYRVAVMLVTSGGFTIWGCER